MNRFLTFVLLMLIAANGWYAWYQWKHALPTTTDIDADIAQVDHEIADASQQMIAYGDGSLLQTVVDARKQIFLTTRAMLDQKRLSLLRGINITYLANGQAWTPDSADQLKAIEAELAAQDAKTTDADVKAASSGGLFAILGQVNAMIEHMTSSMLRQRYLAAKFGLPYAPAVERAAAEQKRAIGTIVKDQNAL